MDLTERNRERGGERERGTERKMEKGGERGRERQLGQWRKHS